jgi:hypothetical protein
MVFDNNKHMIALTMIKVSGAHCIHERSNQHLQLLHYYIDSDDRNGLRHKIKLVGMEVSK